MIKRIKRANVTEEVFLQMKQLIIEQKWKVGQKIPSENELCKLFDVSRVTVRNAIQKLIALDMIETIPGNGSFVKMIDNAASFNRLIPTVYFEENMEVILEFRRILESGTSALAAVKANDEDVIELRRILKDMEDLQDNLEELADSDLDLHYKIAQISRNPLIIKTYEIVADIYRTHMRRMVKSIGGT